MNNIKQKIAALSLASSMLTFLSSCKNNDKNIEYVDINSLYIIDLENNLGDKSNLFLCNEEYNCGNREYHKYDDWFICIAKYQGELTSDYGKIKNIIPLTDIVLYYNNDINRYYNINEVEDIFEKTKEDYNEINSKQKEKKLTN